MSSENRKSKGKKRGRRSVFGRVIKRSSGVGFVAQWVEPGAPRGPGGRRRYTTRAVRTRTEGETLLKEIHRALILGRYAPVEPEKPTADGLTVLDAVDQYIEAAVAAGRRPSTLRRYRSNRLAIEQSPLARKAVTDLAPTDIETYIAWRRERRWWTRRNGTDKWKVQQRKDLAPTNATINRDLLVLGAAMNRLKRLGLIETNPVERVKPLRESKKKRAVLSKEEAKRLLDACSESFRPLVLAGLLTGARANELIELRWRDVDLAEKTLTLNRTKSHLVATIPLHPVLATELKRIRKARKPGATDHVFLSSKGSPYRYYGRAWQTAVRKAGLADREGLVFHSLRHTFATAYLSGGAAISDLQGLLGHASVATTQIYSRMVDKRARASLEAVAF